METEDKRRSTISRVSGYFRQARDTLETLEENIISLLQEDQEEVQETSCLEETVLEEMAEGDISSRREEGLEEVGGDTKKSCGSDGVETRQTTRPDKPELRKPKIGRKEDLTPLLEESELILPPVPLSFDSDEEPRIKKYLKLPALGKGDDKRVKVGSVESPEYFTVHFSYSGGYFLDMELQVKMQEVSESELEPLRLVEVDNACLIKDKDVFYRGRVVGVDGEMVTVLLVDTGEQQVRHLTNIYEIEERFTNVAETSQNAMLACVRPSDGKSNWPASSITALRERIKGKEFLMFIQEEKEGKTPLSVILYETHHNKDLCINFWLSSINEATLTSDACMRLEYFKPALGKTSLVYAEDSKEPETDTYNTFPARVVAIQSPSNISVISLRNEPDLERLQKQMQDHYGDSTDDPNTHSTDLTVGSLVAAHIDQNGGLWARGKIKEFKKFGGCAVVQLLDFAETKKIQVEKLQPLAKMFKKVFMDKVHLSGVCPTSTSGNWSKDATEGLREILQRSSMKVELRCLGKSANQSLPVKMLVVDETGGLVDVENLMVEAKMALGGSGLKSSVDDEELTSPPAEREEIDIKQWQPAELLRPGTTIEGATATFVDWSGRVHLVKDQAALRLISRVLAAKYNNSKMRPGKYSQVSLCLSTSIRYQWTSIGV